MSIVLICSCSKKNSEPNLQETSPVEETVIEPEEVQEIIDIIDPVIDNNGTYLDENRSLACVIIPDLRMRDAPEGNLIKEQYDKTKNKHAPMMCYAYFDERKIDDIKWLKIGNNLWIGTKEEWIKGSHINENRNFIADLIDIPDKEWDPYGPSVFSVIEEVKKLMDCDEHELEIASYLKKTMPGLSYGSVGIVDFDSRNPSEEAKKALFYMLILNYHQLLFQNLDTKRQEEAENLVIKQDQLNNDIHEYYLYCGIPEENLNYVTSKLYGNTIDFRTVAWYVAQYNTYIFSEPTGFGSIDSMVNVIDYEETESEVFVHGSVFCVDLMEKDNIHVIGENYNHMQDDISDYLNNKAKQFDAVIRKTELGEYQLITVDVK